MQVQGPHARLDRGSSRRAIRVRELNNGRGRRDVTVLLLRFETFSKQLLDIGDGKVTIDENGCIKLPIDFFTIINSQDALIDQIFPNVHTHKTRVAGRKNNFSSKKCGHQRIESQDTTIVARVLVSYKSIDKICDATEAVNYPTEFLISLDLPGTPPHNLQLKVGSPVILLRNLNPSLLCNGARLVIKN
ncbi:hypothetical protein EVAR_7072_1 [Eumeta japonica]|uniref:DNA helicase Pif1-like 2B domain-containing protein n=1 Tax=Eumeta variegata TaxID=151549 RepID=A0A4C1XCH6_EUMVA|nr:hypothetical protein EVAR_7072_1 [Eumeta japonica]